MLTIEEIEKRKLLWQTLSDLWLDTELTDAEYQVIVREMLASGYSLSEIERIYAEEVAPVVYSNLFSTTGVWGAFEPEWLYNEIIKNLEKQEKNLLYRTWVRSSAGQFVMTKMVRNDWEKILSLYRQKNESLLLNQKK